MANNYPRIKTSKKHLKHSNANNVPARTVVVDDAESTYNVDRDSSPKQNNKRSVQNNRLSKKLPNKTSVDKKQ